jgi:hypothetical protein
MAAAASSNMHTGRTIMLERDAEVGFTRPLCEREPAVTCTIMPVLELELELELELGT